MKTATRTNGIAGGGGMKTATPSLTRCPDPNCGGNLSPQTNGNGGLKDVCDKCHRTVPAVGGRLASLLPAAAASSRSQNGTRKCDVDGCPGHLDANGTCQCCVSRAMWEEKNAPKKSCEICGGDIFGARKRCKPCAKLFTKVSVARKKEPALT